LAAGLHSNPLGELSALPRLLAGLKGWTSGKREGQDEGRGREVNEKGMGEGKGKGRKGEGKGGRGRKEVFALVKINSWVWPRTGRQLPD